MATASSMQHVNSVSKSMIMYGAEGTGGIASSTNQLVYFFAFVCAQWTNFAHTALLFPCLHQHESC